MNVETKVNEFILDVKMHQFRSQFIILNKD